LSAKACTGKHIRRRAKQFGGLKVSALMFKTKYFQMHSVFSKRKKRSSLQFSTFCTLWSLKKRIKKGLHQKLQPISRMTEVYYDLLVAQLERREKRGFSAWQFQICPNLFQAEGQVPPPTTPSPTPMRINQFAPPKIMCKIAYNKTPIKSIGRIPKVNLSWTRKKVRLEWCKRIASVFISLFFALKARLPAFKFEFCQINFG